ncbi:hypothetical protein TSAR_009665 [Trichomalopsis sarcophagae]|uniref:Uncharacterized protein n=1 Tax=Trichomalopsis sarcophagae TaxID=543379 RepID=A0A232ELP7_9HYME|nr:hypothetical protein TSAR_009665 [Trichomalopsis sarcophagae]
MSKDMTTNNLQINWSYEAFTFDKLLQKEAYNCGVFVIIDSGNVRDLYIDSDVINAFSMINEKNWKNCVSVPTQHTKILLKEISEKEIDADWFMFHLQGEFKGKILMPHETNGHWCLFIVFVDKRVLLHMDPLQNEKKIKRVDGQPFASKVF